MSIVLAILLFAIWSISFPLGKWTLQFSSPIFLTGLRMTLAAGIVLPFLFVKKKASLRLPFKQFLSIALLGFFSIYLTNILEYWALDRLTAAKTCFFYGLTPFFTALLSYIHFKERMTGVKWLGMCIGFCGFLPVLFLNETPGEVIKSFQFFSWPEIAIMGAAFFSVYGWIILRLVVTEKEIAPPVANGYSMLIGGAMAIIHSLMLENWAPLPVSKEHILPLMQGIVILTLISNVLCYNLYGYLLKRFTATLLSFFGLLSPIYASLHSWILLNEPISPLLLASSMVVLLGLVVVYREELRQGYVKLNVSRDIQTLNK